MSKKILSLVIAFAMCAGITVNGFAPVTASAAWSHTTHNNEYVQMVEFYYPPTCITKGYRQYTCTICGESHYENIDALGHNDGIEVVTIMPTCTEDGEAVTTCSRCGTPTKVRKINKTGHNNGVWQVDFEATSEHDGQMTRRCTKCGMVLETKTFKAHSHKAGHTATLKEATCTVSGQKGTFCAECGACYATSDIAPTGHTDAENSVWAITTPATCTEKGEKTGYCGNCGTITGTEEIEALGHDEGVWCKHKIAGCTTSGEERCYCKRCGEVTDKNEIEPLGHTGDTWTVTKAADCTHSGEKICACERCGVVYKTEPIAATGHDDGVWKIDFEPGVNVVDADGKMYGQMTRYCSICDTKLETKIFYEHDHSNGYTKIIKNPGCITSGETETICRDCGEVYETSVLEPLGHTGDTWTVTKAADCTHDGEKICKCERCGVVYQTESIAAAGHDDGVWKIDFEPNINVVDEEGRMYGQMTRYCSICDTKLETKNYYMHKHSKGYTRTVKPAGCLTSGETETVCAECKEVYETSVLEPLGHSYSPWATNNDGTHSCTCDRCGDVQKANCVYNVQTTESDCDNGGFTTYTCTVCGYEHTGDETFSTGHTFGEWHDCNDGVTHERVCADCGETQYGYHLYDDWKTEDNRTFWETWVEDETITHTCVICGASESQLVPHSSIISKALYPFGYWIVNLVRKAFYAVTLDWIFPWINIPYDAN